MRNRRQKFRNAGEIDKGKGGTMTQKEDRSGGIEEKLRLFRKKRAGEGNLCNLNQW